LQDTRIIRLPNAEVRVLPDATTLARAAADAFLHVARESIAASGRFTVALSGGSTPKAIFKLLAHDHATGANLLPWDQVQIFFGDERHVPPDHPDSNHRMANETLLSQVPIPAGNIHRIEGELDAADAAARYEARLRLIFQIPEKDTPRFDLVLLGMGSDGHTASLFAGSAGLGEMSSLVCANWVEKFQGHRITFTFPLINAAAAVLFIAGGADKTTMLRNILHGDPAGQTYPAQAVRPVNGRLTWLIDEAAAGQL
jgi:6-phosphogluconolactonase